jgi:hypothetical protein
VLQICEISKTKFFRIDLQRGRFLFLHSLGRLRSDARRRPAVNFLLRRMVLPQVALVLFVASPFLPSRWRQTWKRFAV